MNARAPGGVVTRHPVFFARFRLFAQRGVLAALRVTTDCVLVQDQEPNAADLADGVVLLSVRAGSYFGFNQIASEIWTMLAAPRQVGEIFDAIAKRHSIDGETVARDVTPFLETLIEHQLVRMIGPGEVA